MRKEFASNLVLLLAINFLVKPLYLFGVDLGVQNAVGTEEYGRYATAFSFAFLFGMIYDMGLQNYNAVTLSKQPGLYQERAPVMLSLKLVLAVIYAITVLVFAWLWQVEGRGMQLVGLAICYHVTASLLQLLRTNLAAQGKYKLNSIISVVDKVLLIVGLGLILLTPVWRDWLSIELFFCFQILALSVAILFTLAGTDHGSMPKWFDWDKAAIVGMLKATFPYGLILLLATLSTRIDVVMLERFHPLGNYEAGKYAGAYRLLDGINMVGFMFATLLLPMLSKLVEAGQPAGKLLKQASGNMIAIGVGFAAWTTFYSSELVTALYNEADSSWGMCLSWLMWAAVGVGLTYVYGSYLLAQQRLRSLNWIFVAATVINISINVALIPTYGATGAAIATVISFSIVAILEVWLSTKEVKLKEQFQAIEITHFVFVLLVLLSAYLLKAFDVGMVWSLIIQIVMCAIAGFSTGLLIPTDIINRIRSKTGQST